MYTLAQIDYFNRFIVRWHESTWSTCRRRREEDVSLEQISHSKSDPVRINTDRTVDRLDRFNGFMSTYEWRHCVMHAKIMTSCVQTHRQFSALFLVGVIIRQTLINALSFVSSQCCNLWLTNLHKLTFRMYCKLYRVETHSTFHSAFLHVQI